MNRLIHKIPLQDNVVKGERKKILISFSNQSNVTGRNRMHVAVDDNHYSYYTYDHGGERRLKLTGENHLVDINANHMATYSALSRPNLYPSAYMVVSTKGYTKHYYAGAERVAARIGGGGLDAIISLADGGDSLRTKANSLYAQSLGQVNNRALEKNEPDCIAGSVAEQDELKVWIEEIPEWLQASTLIDYGEFTDVVQSLRADHNGGQERNVYFYHSDHLGSTSWITDSGGHAIQHLQYLPYGEPYINQRTSGYSERFTFTGKERDEETGYGYFGARYMDNELMTMWLSVDPMADKYPSISPYAYCVWNPVKLIDPDGRDWDPDTEKDVINPYRAEIKKRMSMIEKKREYDGNPNLYSDQYYEYQSILQELSALEDDHNHIYKIEPVSHAENDGIVTLGKMQDNKRIINIKIKLKASSIKGNSIFRHLEVISHELKHVYQFYQGRLGFIIDKDGNQISSTNTRELEREAFTWGICF